ncbi:MAG: hypothetical protein Q8M88_11825 [Phenylobacterium sp.]|uniref:hypothetical protein n=1 Tax=Phenylobacterium sp. TaxID=1871053 RepID=UPI002732333B|nr:hypothetical protein [Phenylobacterium sp.]MDP3175110.1 hypothetical protein [Phenylobacterium sp.]
MTVSTLSNGQLTALKNLERKQAGETVDWINIGDARALTDLGFAERTREGWVITAAGSALLAAGKPPGAPDDRR